MISSIILIILNLLGKINADESLEFFKPYSFGVIIEVTTYILTLPKIMNKFDEWRDKND